MIFAIKRFETHDGDGIRTTVFFKGCPLRCAWCHNPESFSGKKEIAYDPELCADCGRCTSPCTANELRGGVHVFNREACTLCGKCTELCPRGAFSFYGDERSAEELANELLYDKMFFDGSGGGVTLSGGEPLMQEELCLSLARLLKEKGVNVAIDTSGYAERRVIEKILPYVDTFLYDIKAIDPDVHKKCTGKTNEIILENLKYIDGAGKDVEIRIPYVPEYNGGEMKKIAEFIRELKNVKRVKVLPYHKYAEMKYISLDIKDRSPEMIPSEEEMKRVRELIGVITGIEIL